MNIQFVRLDDDICNTLNRMAADKKRTVTEMVNDILRDYLRKIAREAREDAASA